MKTRLFSILALLFISCNFLLSQNLENDSLALVDFYHALDGDNWIDSDQWLEGPVTEWKGITVRDGRVTQIRLRSNGLKGSIPESINNLSELTELNIADNEELTGPLPNMDSLTQVTRLFLEHTSINGPFPDAIRGMTSLVIFNLSDSGIEGPIPAWLSELQSLESIYLFEADLNSSFPEVLKEIPTLRFISFYNAGITGPLPDLSVLQNLEGIEIGANDLGGSFPGWIVNIPNLRTLDIQSCNLSGSIPDSLFSYLRNDFREFTIGGNSFEGDISRFLTGDSTKLWRFNIFNNNFSGAMPEGSIDVNTIYRWTVANNNLTGILDFSEVDHVITWFYAHRNKLPFEELEKLLSIQTSQPNRLGLSPQKPLLEEETHHLSLGEDLVMEAGSRGSITQYQWYRNGEMLPGETDRLLVIDGLTEDQYGVYNCIMTHDSFEFDLVRSDVTVSPLVSTKKLDENLFSVNLFPNPGQDFIRIQTDETIIRNVKLWTLNGKLIEEQEAHSKMVEIKLGIEVPQTMIIHIETDEGTIRKTWIKK